MTLDIKNIFEAGIQLDDLHFWMDACANNQEAFMAFWKIAQDKNQKNNWRALWVIEHAIQKNKDNINLILPELFKLLVETDNNSIMRIGLKLAIIHPLKEDDIIGELLNKCEGLLLNTKTPIATRANSLQFIFEFCKIEPDFTNELKAILDHIGEHESSGGMKSRIRIINKALNKMGRKE
jgi:hypothetical protein